MGGGCGSSGMRWGERTGGLGEGLRELWMARLSSLRRVNRRKHATQRMCRGFPRNEYIGVGVIRELERGLSPTSNCPYSWHRIKTTHRKRRTKRGGLESTKDPQAPQDTPYLNPRSL